MTIDQRIAEIANDVDVWKATENSEEGYFTHKETAESLAGQVGWLLGLVRRLLLANRPGAIGFSRNAHIKPIGWKHTSRDQTGNSEIGVRRC